MRIKPLSQRVIYENNPLAEVVCQVRFAPVDLNGGVAAAFGTALDREAFPIYRSEDVSTVEVRFDQQDLKSTTSQTTQKIHHYISKDRNWKVALTNDFVALTCLKYERWEKFSESLYKIINLVAAILPGIEVSRIGLRYRDIIDRERIGLSGVPWRDLISNFLIGPFATNDLLESGEFMNEGDIQSSAFQTILNLEECKVLLQGGLIFSSEGQRQAFMIDTDFFHAAPEIKGCMSDFDLFSAELEKLHKNAGSMFAALIRERLHDALKPKSIAQ